MVVVLRWFKFTLKPPNSITHGNLLSAIWDTSHWNFFVKFGLKTAWHISYDILWSLLTYVNFWQLQGHLSTFAKIRGLQKIKVFSMKERSVVDEAWGFRWADNWATWWYHFLGGVTHLRGAGGRRKKKRHFSGHLQWLKRVLGIDPFDQESDHRCSLGCSTYLDADFWIRDWLAICWAIKWQFLRCQKVADFFDLPKFQNFEP